MLRHMIGLAMAGALAALAPARAAPPVETYGKLPAIELMQLSPSGERYAFIAVAGDARKLFIATTDNKLIESDPIGNAKVRGIEWAGDDHVLVSVSTTVNLGPDFEVQRQELSTVVVIDLRTHKSFSVFNGHREVANFVNGGYGVAQIDGHWYGYFGTITYHKGVGPGALDYPLVHGYSDLYRVDLDTGDLKMAWPGLETSDGWLVGPNGEVIAEAFYTQKTGAWRVQATARDSKAIAAGRSEFGGVAELSRGRTPDTVLIERPSGHGGYIYQEASLSGGPTTDIPDSDRISGTLSNRGDHLWIGTIAESDEQESTFFAPALQARMAAARRAFPGYFVHLVSYSADFGRLLVFTDGKDDSGSYWLVDVDKHSASSLGQAYPTIGPADVGSVRMVDWKAADGLALRGVLTLPPGRDAKALPLIVFPHGGPEGRDYPSFDWWAQAFASRGYAVFQPNFRGSSGYGVDFRNAGFGQWGRKMQTDISDGVAELVKQGIVDPKRACIVGASYGGYAALAGVAVQHGLYRCAVSVAGVADLAAMLASTREETGTFSNAVRYWKAFMGVTSALEGELGPLSPVNLAERADAPIMLIHGKDDTTVPFVQSQNMEAALRRAGKPVELVVMPHEDHNLSREATRTLMLKSAVAFVEKYNPPDPAK
jgi:dipeptidyl aminopeptidase/acylaminoacyl peptidase